MQPVIIRRPLPGWGTTYGPSGDGPFPAVMVLHGSEGAWAGWSHRHAVMLAAHGFLAFPLGFSVGGNAWNAGQIIEVPLERTVAALQALRGFAFTGQGVGLYGASRGAEHALLVASLMARDSIEGLPDSLAAHAPPDVVCGGFDARTFRDSGDPGWQAWDGAQRAWSWQGSSEGLLPTTPIEIERYDGPLFLSHGTADIMWSVAMTRRLEARLKRHGRTPEVVYMQGEGHIPGDEAENDWYARLMTFFARTLMA
ncbi:alpha/beta hydrolase family protein [Kushneria marisflavi]|uniref:Thioesterase n=1 Tax=Kushneria marisflavi TaxID=157779 RepID=A0A240UU36_9GAMM|nr:acyl-CoA thioester hydrolase/BAAT C-terminal domain-containing protein [Kushneria marisflavi]ART64562.1 thioesterase [Kushneria marisflavi]RKD87353.1 prolyl oligopeptidase family protein [Kushneria marisflavi]